MKIITGILPSFFLVMDLSAQIDNPGFEAWDTTFNAAYQDELTNIFQIPGAISGIIHGTMVSNTGFAGLLMPMKEIIH